MNLRSTLGLSAFSLLLTLACGNTSNGDQGGSGGDGAGAEGGSSAAGGAENGGSDAGGSGGAAEGGAGGVSAGGSGGGPKGGAGGVSTGGSGGAPKGGAGGVAAGGSGGAAKGGAGGVSAGGSGGAPKGGAGGSAGGTGGTSTAPIAITVIGSSSAAGKNLDQPTYGGRVGGLADTWASRYEVFLNATRPGSTVRNLAVPGYSTYNAQPTGTVNPSGLPAVDTTKNITAALNPKPDAIIAYYPALAQVVDGTITVDDIVANLRRIVNAAAAMNVPVWIAATQPNRDATAQELVLPKSYIARIEQEFGPRTIDFWTPFMNANGTVKTQLFLTDSSGHPNAEGHRLQFEQVKALNLPAAVGK